MKNPIAILSAKRTPIGAFQGSLSTVSAPQLASVAIKSVVEAASLNVKNIDEAFVGNVLSAGLGQAPARQAVLGAGLPQSIRCTGVSKVCGSGMESIILAANTINAGEAEIVIAAGMESMSHAPYLSLNARSGMRMGHQKLIDSMLHDGLWDPYDDVHMGNCGEFCAEKYNFTREEQDQYTKESLSLAQNAIEKGLFNNEIVPVEVKQRKSTHWVDTDEQPSLAKPEKISRIRPVFKEGGTITAANASSINDGAAALILASEEAVKKHNLQPIAWLKGQSIYAHEPKWFTTAPVKAIEKLLKRYKLSASKIGLWEINEAFSVVSMATIKDLKLDRSKVNVHGGATVLGHPIGCSGARITVTLIHALLQNTTAACGIASLCIGGGETIAIWITKKR